MDMLAPSYDPAELRLGYSLFWAQNKIWTQEFEDSLNLSPRRRLRSKSCVLLRYNEPRKQSKESRRSRVSGSC
jgi:hypothetical protein